MPEKRGLSLFRALSFEKSVEAPPGFEPGNRGFADLSDLPLETRVRLETLLEQTLPRIDADGEKWKHSILQRRHAAYSKQKRDAGEEPISFDAYCDWANRAEELGLPGSPL